MQTVHFTDVFEDFVDHVMQRRDEVPPLSTLCLRMERADFWLLPAQICKWMKIALSRCVKDMTLGVVTDYKIPSDLLISHTLERLRIEHGSLSAKHGEVKMPRLRTLYLAAVKFEGPGETTLENIISGCDKLEQLGLEELGSYKWLLFSTTAESLQSLIENETERDWFRTGRRWVQNKAVMSSGKLGRCFPLKGTSGFVQIRLRRPVIPDAVTLQHASKAVAYDRSSAPKDCRVSGWLEAYSKSGSETKLLLTEFRYDKNRSDQQRFNIPYSARSGLVNTIGLDFTSNHGSSSRTCIYSFSIHGHE